MADIIRPDFPSWRGPPGIRTVLRQSKKMLEVRAPNISVWLLPILFGILTIVFWWLAGSFFERNNSFVLIVASHLCAVGSTFTFVPVSIWVLGQEKIRTGTMIGALNAMEVVGWTAMVIGGLLHLALFFKLPITLWGYS